MSKCIVLDAGHGRYGNPYPTIEGKYEGTQNFIYAGKLASRLKAAGFTVLLTRPDIDDDPQLSERGALAGKNNAVLFLSLHSNAPGSSTPPEPYLMLSASAMTAFTTLSHWIQNGSPAQSMPLKRAKANGFLK